jgi:hypothetical protein
MSAKLGHADHMLHTNAMAYGKENRELIEKLEKAKIKSDAVLAGKQFEKMRAELQNRTTKINLQAKKLNLQKANVR